MRKKIVAGNWKMNMNFQDAEDLMFEISDELTEKGSGETEVIVCPPAVYLEMSSDIAAENGFMVGAQNLSEWESGAYTGEISASMLHSMGISHCILGHSERRTYFGENDKVIAVKIDLALKNGIIPIYCCGEVLAERQAEKHFDVIRSQVGKALFHLGKEAVSQVIIAYEPVWAIGTGVTASAIAASLKYGGTSFYVNTAGGRLFVSFTNTGDTFKEVKLTGPAKLVFEGTIEI